MRATALALAAVLTLVSACSKKTPLSPSDSIQHAPHQGHPDDDKQTPVAGDREKKHASDSDRGMPRGTGMSGVIGDRTTGAVDKANSKDAADAR